MSEAAAVAVKTIGNEKYGPAVLFLREFAGLLYDVATRLAQEEGIEPKPLAEQEFKLAAAKTKLVN